MRTHSFAVDFSWIEVNAALTPCMRIAYDHREWLWCVTCIGLRHCVHHIVVRLTHAHTEYNFFPPVISCSLPVVTQSFIEMSVPTRINRVLFEDINYLCGGTSEVTRYWNEPRRGKRIWYRSKKEKKKLKKGMKRGFGISSSGSEVSSVANACNKFLLGHACIKRTQFCDER